MKKLLTIFGLLALLLMATPAPTEASNSFSDVPTSNQFYTSIEWATNNGLLKGYDNGTFKPKNNLTEAQFTIILSRYLNPALTNKIVPQFERNEVYDYIKSYNLPIKGIANEKLRNHTYTRIDVARVFASLATGQTVTDKEAIDWMYNAGITTGKGVNPDKYLDFGSTDSLKREHISAFFKRLDDSPSFESPISREVFSKASNFAPTNYKLIDLQQATFDTDTSTVQYVAQYKQISEERFLFKILTYNKDNKRWSVSYEYKTDEYRHLNMEVISISDNPDENQVLIYAWKGSGGYLSAKVLGAYDDVNFNVEDVPYHLFQGDYKMINGALHFYQGVNPEAAFNWLKGELVETSFTIIEPGKNDIVVTYDLDKYNTLHSNIAYYDTLNVKVGQKLQFIQESSYLDHYTVRIMYGIDPDIINVETGKFVKEGMLRVSIIPNGYDWDDALEFFIRVTK